MTATAVQRWNATQDYLGNKLVNVGAPTAGGDAANKSYVDATAQGLAWKEVVRAAATTNIANLGAAGASIDGVTLADGDRVLLMGQTDRTQNGIYVWTAGVLARASDADTGAKLRGGSIVTVSEGGGQGNKTYVMITDGAITLGTSNIDWTLANNNTAPVYTGGNGITISGSSIAVNPKTSGGLAVSSQGAFVVTDPNGGVSVGAAGIAVVVDPDSALSVGPAGLAVVPGDGLTVDHNNLLINLGDGVGVNGSNFLEARADSSSPIVVTASGIGISLGNGVAVSGGGALVAVAASGSGLTVGGSGITLNRGFGLDIDHGNLVVVGDAATGVVVNSSGVGLTLDPARALTVGGSGLGVALATNGGLFSDNTSGGILVKLDINGGLTSSAQGVAAVAAPGGGIDVDNTGIAVDATVARVYTEVIGDGVADTFTVNHALGKRAVLVQVFDSADGEEVGCGVARDDANNVSLAFGVAPTSGQYTVVVVG